MRWYLLWYLVCLQIKFLISYAKKDISFGTSVVLVLLILSYMTITWLHFQDLLHCSVAHLFSDFQLMSNVFLFVCYGAWWILLLPGSLTSTKLFHVSLPSVPSLCLSSPLLNVMHVITVWFVCSKDLCSILGFVKSLWLCKKACYFAYPVCWFCLR